MQIHREICNLIENSIRKTRGIEIMLCGKSLEKNNSVRKKIFDLLDRERILSSFHDFFIQGKKKGVLIKSIYLPEKEFKEELYGKLSYRFDLLNFENQLAELIDIVIIVLESPGAIAELGAFANHEILNKKLIVVVSREHIRDKSFIIKGPIRYLKKNKLNQVIYTDYDKINSSIITRIYKSITTIIGESDCLEKYSISEREKRFIYVLILLFGFTVLSENLIIKYFSIAFQYNEEEAFKGLYPLLASLKKDKYIFKNKQNYQITLDGMRYLHRRTSNLTEFDKYRIKMLNYTRRGKRKIFQGSYP
ncbi:retron St85 family effector protein [bacterium]|nr:retron St85 family effector protein [bacterium]